MVDLDSEVTIYGYGDFRYVDIPTFRERSILKDSLNVIKDFLDTLSEKERLGYCFEVRRSDRIYFYFYERDNKSSLEFNEKYKDLEEFFLK